MRVQGVQWELGLEFSEPPCYYDAGMLLISIVMRLHFWRK